MVSGSRIEGGPQILSAGVRKTIQYIKEIVGNHSDADIYVTLKETNMDPNETTQKLLNQDHFHEVKRKKDKRKEVTVNKGSIASQPRIHTEHVNQGMRFNTYSDRNIRRGGYSRNALPDARVSREFRVVRDNRTNQNTNSEIKAPSARSPISTNELEIPKISEKSSPTGASNNQKPPVGRHSSQSSNGFTDLHPRQARDAHLSDKKDSLEDMRLSIPNTGSQMQSMKPSDFQPNSTTSSNYSVAGVYSSSSDPVHVPSPDSRPATNIGAIKREVGAVGVRRQSIENSFNLSSAQPNSFFKSHMRHDSPSRESFQSSTDMSKSDQPNQTPVSEPSMPSISVSKPFMNNQFSSRQHQPVGHQKASQTNKEWKPKLTQKQSSIGPGVIGTPAKLTSPPADVPKNLETDAVLLQDKFSRVNIAENQNVIIAAHIRVSETDRSRMIFGSLGTEFESFRNPSFQAIEGAEVSHIEPSTSLSFSAPESYSDESSGKKQVDLLDECVRNSGTNSPAASMTVSELQLTDRNESSSPQDLDNYADIALVHDKSPSYTPQSQQQQDHPQLPSFSAYDPQTMYDIPYFRSAVNETVRGHGLQFPQEALSSHTANSISASTVSMVQQPPPMTQMYPQVHVSHYANLMPYRQFLSPVYVPPMAVPSYSNNPAYPHPSNGNGYLVMPGGSHLTASGLKYGIQQYKPVPSGSPTGFGNFTSPTGYTINAPGVSSATGLEDSSRLKYKDGNLYVPNPQAETSEIWMNPRDLPSLQSASFYMTGQTPHAAYLPSHNGHASFNKISSINAVVKVLELALKKQRPLLIVAEDVEGEALATLILNKLRAGVKVCAIKAPGFGENRKANLQDLAVLTGGQVITEELGMNLDNVELDMFGSCKEVTISKDDTVVLDGAGDKKAIEERCEQIRSAIESSTSDYDKEKFQERLAKLSGGVAVLKIGGASETEVGEKKDRVTDALNATKAAVEEGIVPGGGVALLYATKELDKLPTANFDQKIGVQIIRDALKTPVHTIASNAGVEGAVVVGKLLEQDDPDLGFDAAKGAYVDMVKAGIIDPLKVIRTALVDAASVSSLMTTTEAIVVELPKDEKEVPMGGGMGGMGGMDF